MWGMSDAMALTWIFCNTAGYQVVMRKASFEDILKYLIELAGQLQMIVVAADLVVLSWYKSPA